MAVANTDNEDVSILIDGVNHQDETGVGGFELEALTQTAGVPLQDCLRENERSPQAVGGSGRPVESQIVLHPPGRC